MIILILILLILIILRFGKIRFMIDINVQQEGDDLVAKLNFTFFKYRFKLPYVEIEERFSFSDFEFIGRVNERFKREVKIDEKLEEGERNKGDIAHIINFFNQVKKVFTHIEDVVVIIDKCDDFWWVTNFGLVNQAYTGILTGMIWAVKGSVVSILQNFIRFEATPVIKVDPSFNYPQDFGMEFEGIFTFKIGDIIHMGLKILISQLKRRLKKNGRPPN